MGIPIDQKQVIKYLGVQIDDKLNWNFHITQVKQKVSQGIGILRKVKFLIPPYFISNVYSSFIQSHLFYANLAWASPNTSSNTLDKLINQSHKIMNSLNLDKFLNLNHIYKLECCKLIFELHLNTLPPSINSMFKKTNQVYTSSSYPSSY